MSELILAGHGVSMQFASHWLLHYTKDVKMLQNVDSFIVIKIRRTLTIHAIGRISTPGAFTLMPIELAITASIPSQSAATCTTVHYIQLLLQRHLKVNNNKTSWYGMYAL